MTDLTFGLACVKPNAPFHLDHNLWLIRSPPMNALLVKTSVPSNQEPRTQETEDEKKLEEQGTSTSENKDVAAVLLNLPCFGTNHACFKTLTDLLTFEEALLEQIIATNDGSIGQKRLTA